jgi:hypothetical protein
MKEKELVAAQQKLQEEEIKVSDEKSLYHLESIANIASVDVIGL